MELCSFRVLAQPVAKPWPLAEQGLVGDFDVSGAGGEKPGIREYADDAVCVRVRGGFELVDVRPPSDDAAVIIHDGHSKQDGSGEFLLVARELGVSRLGEPGDRRLNAAGLAIGG